MAGVVELSDAIQRMKSEVDGAVSASLAQPGFPPAKIQALIFEHRFITDILMQVAAQLRQKNTFVSQDRFGKNAYAQAIMAVKAFSQRVSQFFKEFNLNPNPMQYSHQLVTLITLLNEVNVVVKMNNIPLRKTTIPTPVDAPSSSSSSSTVTATPTVSTAPAATVSKPATLVQAADPVLAVHWYAESEEVDINHHPDDPPQGLRPAVLVANTQYPNTPVTPTYSQGKFAPVSGIVTQSPSMPPHVELSKHTIGDLHGNAKLLLFFLIKKGAATLSVDDYNAFITIYDKNVEDLTEGDIAAFDGIVARMKVREGANIRLIGDEVFDRGSNDYFTLKLIDRLDQGKANVEIIRSNHGAGLQHAIERERNASSYHPPSTNLSKATQGDEYRQDRSHHGLSVLLNKGLVKKEEMDRLYDVYKTKIKVMSYDRNPKDNTIMTFSHAPLGLCNVVMMAVAMYNGHEAFRKWVDANAQSHDPKVQALAFMIQKTQKNMIIMRESLKGGNFVLSDPNVLHVKLYGSATKGGGIYNNIIKQYSTDPIGHGSIKENSDQVAQLIDHMNAVAAEKAKENKLYELDQYNVFADYKSSILGFNSNLENMRDAYHFIHPFLYAMWNTEKPPDNDIPNTAGHTLLLHHTVADPRTNVSVPVNDNQNRICLDGPLGKHDKNFKGTITVGPLVTVTTKTYVRPVLKPAATVAVGNNDNNNNNNSSTLTQ